MTRDDWRQEVNGRTLDLWPVNAPIGTIAFEVGSGRPARVVLQPGDMTRYEFFLVPLFGSLLRETGGYDPNLAYVAHVEVLQKTTGAFKGVCLAREVFPGDSAHYENEHTRHVMAAFHNAFRTAYRATCETVSRGS